MRATLNQTLIKQNLYPASVRFAHSRRLSRLRREEGKEVMKKMKNNLEPLLEKIEINSKVMLGKPVIKGTRIPVEIILKKLSQNISVKEILKDYPQLEQKDIQAALLYAGERIGTEETYLLTEVGV